MEGTLSLELFRDQIEQLSKTDLYTFVILLQIYIDGYYNEFIQSIFLYCLLY